MMPPVCSICFAPCAAAEIVCFAVTAEERREQEAISKAENEGVSGHPSNVSWFCALHHPEAAALAELPAAEARSRMNGTNRFRCEQVGFWVPTSLSLIDERTETRRLLDIPDSETRGHSWSWQGNEQRLFVQYWSNGVPHPGQPLDVLEQWSVETDGGEVSFASVRRDDGTELRAWFRAGEAHYGVVAAGFERRVFEALLLGAG